MGTTGYWARSVTVRMSLIAVAFAPGVVLSLSAADPAAKPAERPEVRRPFREMTPEERQARFKEMEEKFGPAPFTIEELRRMPPEERQLKLRAWREGRFSFTPAERQRRRLQIKQRLTRQIAELQKSKAAGTISDEDRARLERLELIAHRFDRLNRPTTNGSLSSTGATAVAPAPKAK